MKKLATYFLAAIFILSGLQSVVGQHPLGTTQPKLNPEVSDFKGNLSAEKPEKQDVNNPPTRSMKFRPIKSSSEVHVEGPKKDAGLRSNIQSRVVQQKEERASSTKSYNQSGSSASIDPKKKAIIRMNQSRQSGAYAPAGVLKAVNKNVRDKDANQGDYSGTSTDTRLAGVSKSSEAAGLIEDVNDISSRKQSKYMNPSKSVYSGPENLATPEKRRQTYRERDNELANYAGAGKYGSLEKRNIAVRIKDRQQGAYDGAISGDALQSKENNMKYHEIQAALYDPGLPAGYLENRDKMRRLKDQEQANNSGDIGNNFLENRDKMRREKDQEQANNSGDIGNNYLANRDKMRRQKDQEQANNSGDIGNNYLANRDKMRRQKDKEQANNDGDIPLNYLLARNQMRRKKDKEQSEYRGDILVSDLYQRERSIRKKSKEIANWQGDIIVNYKKKGMHPSAVYQGGKIQNSYEAKERLRKQVLKKYGKSKDFEIPNYEKKKEQRPTYDPKEAEIWY